MTDHIDRKTQTNKKVCPRCLMNKSLDQFKKRERGGHDGYCIPCSLSYFKEHNYKRLNTPENREKERVRSLTRYHKVGRPARQARKIELIRLLGGCCAICGYSKSAAALDFDHIIPADKLRNLSHLLSVNRPWAWEAAVEEGKKCRVLCSNCHREHTFPGWEMDILASRESEQGTGATL